MPREGHDEADSHQAVADSGIAVAPTDAGTDESADAAMSGVATDPKWQLAELTTAVEGLRHQASAFHARAENYEQIIRQMQGRIEQLQGDQVQTLLKPVIQRFAGLHAQATEAAEQASSRGESAVKDFSFFAVAIEEALGLMDIESIGATASAPFDSSRHHATRIVPTQEPDLDSRVERVLRQGFTYVGSVRVFLPAQVSVYRYESPSSAEIDSASIDYIDPDIGEGANNG